MMKHLTWIGWLAAVCAVAAAAYLHLEGQRLEGQLQGVQAVAARQDRETAELIGRLEEREDLEDEVARLEDELAEAKRTIEVLQPKDEAKAGAEAPANPLLDILSSIGQKTEGQTKPGNPFAALASMFGGKEGEDEDVPKGPLAAVAQMYEGEQGKKLAEYSASMTVNMQYGDMFRDMNLPPETEEQVRDILKRHFARLMKEGMNMLKDGVDEEKAEALDTDCEAELRHELGAVLSPEQMAQREAYEEVMEERMLAFQYDVQLGMFAPGLTPENREVVKEVLVEEMLVAPEPSNLPNAMEVQGVLEREADALQRARERLVDYLDEEQFAEFERFLNQQEQMMQLISQMMGTEGTDDAAE